MLVSSICQSNCIYNILGHCLSHSPVLQQLQKIAVFFFKHSKWDILLKFFCSILRNLFFRCVLGFLVSRPSNPLHPFCHAIWLWPFQLLKTARTSKPFPSLRLCATTWDHQPAMTVWDTVLLFEKNAPRSPLPLADRLARAPDLPRDTHTNKASIWRGLFNLWAVSPRAQGLVAALLDWREKA